MSGLLSMNGLKKYCRTDNHLIVSIPTCQIHIIVQQTLLNNHYETYFVTATIGNGKTVMETLCADGGKKMVALPTVWIEVKKLAQEEA